MLVGCLSALLLHGLIVLLPGRLRALLFDEVVTCSLTRLTAGVPDGAAVPPLGLLSTFLASDVFTRLTICLLVFLAGKMVTRVLTCSVDLPPVDEVDDSDMGICWLVCSLRVLYDEVVAPLFTRLTVRLFGEAALVSLSSLPTCSSLFLSSGVVAVVLSCVAVLSILLPAGALFRVHGFVVVVLCFVVFVPLLSSLSSFRVYDV